METNRKLTNRLTARRNPIHRAVGTIVAIGLTIGALGASVAEPASATPTNLGGCAGAGASLHAGQYLSAGGYTLVMQSDGNLVEYTASGHPLWDTETTGNPGAYLAVQSSDGNLVLYSQAGAVLWSAYVPKSPGDRLCVQSDANVVAYSSAGSALWATMSTVAPTGNLQPSNKNPVGQCVYWAMQEAGTFMGAFPSIHGTYAYQWAASATQNGYLVNSTPSAGSIVVFQAGIEGADSPSGHVAWVTDAYPSQNAIRVTEMNWKGLDVVDTRIVSPAFGVNGVQYIHLNP